MDAFHSSPFFPLEWKTLLEIGHQTNNDTKWSFRMILSIGGLSFLSVSVKIYQDKVKYKSVSRLE